MSYEVYASELPRLFPDGSTKQQNGDTPETQGNGATQTNTGQFKGFTDIVELHRETSAGPELEIIPTNQFSPIRGGNDTRTKRYDEYAVVLRRTWRQKGDALSMEFLELEIRSMLLCREFRKIAVNTYEDTDLESFPIKLQSPFSVLFFYRNQIQSAANDDAIDPDIRNGMKTLHDFIRTNRFMSNLVSDHERYSKESRVSADMLWSAYPPNSLAVLNVDEITECWVCRKVIMKVNREGYFWEISGLRVGFDGNSPVLVRQAFALPYTGVQLWRIADLALIPWGFYKAKDALTATLEKRADSLKKAMRIDFASFSCQDYVGVGWKESLTIYTATTRPLPHAKHIDGRVMVDFKAYADWNRHKIPSPDTFQKPTIPKAAKAPRGIKAVKERLRDDDSDLDSDSDDFVDGNDLDGPNASADLPPFNLTESSRPSSGDSETKPTDLEGLLAAAVKTLNLSETDFNLLFPALVPAFGLKEKAWRWVLSDKLRLTTWNLKAFESLQLEAVTKDLVQALVKGHTIKSRAFDDVVPGKGQGLIFMLHGNPGMGKTLTAESIADYLQRPLYSISGGEIGTDAWNAEHRLDEVFSLAKRWNAVSLLDEADVLFCKRNSSDINRNAIVSVFLRKIEYFQGILFLTTNRKADIDDAFRSRIHVTITYPDLSPEAQGNVWKFLIKTNEKDVDSDDSWTDDVYSALGRLNLDGRTIKNILRTAVAYAQAEDKPLGARHALAIIQTEMKEYDQSEDLLKQREDAVKELQRLLRGKAKAND